MICFGFVLSFESTRRFLEGARVWALPIGVRHSGQSASDTFEWCFEVFVSEREREREETLSARQRLSGCHLHRQASGKPPAKPVNFCSMLRNKHQCQKTTCQKSKRRAGWLADASFKQKPSHLRLTWMLSWRGPATEVAPWRHDYVSKT